MYFIQDTWGFCIICGKYKDLRYGYCFECADIAKDESDLCYKGGLGKYEESDESCSIRCKHSMKCRRKKDANT